MIAATLIAVTLAWNASASAPAGQEPLVNVVQWVDTNPVNGLAETNLVDVGTNCQWTFSCPPGLNTFSVEAYDPNSKQYSGWSNTVSTNVQSKSPIALPAATPITPPIQIKSP